MEGEAGGVSWVFATAGGAVLLGIALAYGIMQSRRGRKRGPLEGPGFDTPESRASETQSKYVLGAVAVAIVLAMAFTIIALV